MSSLRDEGLYSEAELARIERGHHGGVLRLDGSPVSGTGVAGFARRTASGAIIAGMMTRLGEVLEGRPVGEEAAIVRPDPGEPVGPAGGLLVRFDPDCPRRTTVVLGGGGALD